MRGGRRRTRRGGHFFASRLTAIAPHVRVSFEMMTSGGRPISGALRNCLPDARTLKTRIHKSGNEGSTTKRFKSLI